jgi:hypothetical protein
MDAPLRQYTLFLCQIPRGSARKCPFLVTWELLSKTGTVRSPSGTGKGPRGRHQGAPYLFPLKGFRGPAGRPGEPGKRVDRALGMSDLHPPRRSRIRVVT